MNPTLKVLILGSNRPSGLEASFEGSLELLQRVIQLFDQELLESFSSALVQRIVVKALT